MSRRRPLYAVLALVAAGCVGPSPPADEAPLGVDPAILARFGAPIEIGRGADVETSLTVGQDGTVLACSHGGFTGAPGAWASVDGGGTYDRMELPDETPAGDCDVAVGRAAWHVLYSSRRSEVAALGPNTPAFALRLATSTDGGATWTIAEPFPEASLEDRPWIHALGDTLDVVYVPARPRGGGCFERFCNGFDTLMFSRSTNGGASWSQPRAIVVAEEPVFVVDGDIRTWDEGARIAVPLQVIATKDNARNYVAVARSADGGATWATTVAAEQIASASSSFTIGTGPFRFPALDVGADGALALAYARGGIRDATVELIRSDDAGATWSPPLTVATNASFDPGATVTGILLPSVALAVGPDGAATVAWLEAENESGSARWTPHLARAGPDGVLEFSGAAAPAIEGAPYAYEFLAAASARDGRILVVYPSPAKECAEHTTPRNRACVMLLAEKAGPRTPMP